MSGQHRAGGPAVETRPLRMPGDPVRAVRLDPAFEGGREAVTETRGRFIATDHDDVVGTYGTRREALRALVRRRAPSMIAREQTLRLRIRVATIVVTSVAALGLVKAVLLVTLGW